MWSKLYNISFIIWAKTLHKGILLIAIFIQICAKKSIALNCLGVHMGVPMAHTDWVVSCFLDRCFGQAMCDISPSTSLCPHNLPTEQFEYNCSCISLSEDTNFKQTAKECHKGHFMTWNKTFHCNSLHNSLNISWIYHESNQATFKILQYE